jgi:membrane carboxypeptidase/penicillin-binding protein PbpC
VISYSKDLIVWVWVWNIENESMLWVTGITWAWKIWHNIIEKGISLWYISENNNEYKNEEIEEFYSCLDKECVRKERSIKRKNDIFYSFDRDKIIDDRDFFITPTKDEILKLKLAGFTINSQY